MFTKILSSSKPASVALQAYLQPTAFGVIASPVRCKRFFSPVNSAIMFSYLNPLPQLSKYKGPHQVGSTEFEIPVSEIRSTSDLIDARVTTVKFRVFYPTTTSATSKKTIPWLPTPQKIWNQAYAQFMGISERRASWLSHLPSVLNHATIPAVQNGALLNSPDSNRYPVMIFSHGLGGNCNTYSSVLGSLASCGVICIAPEHRDGSAPISLVKSSREKIQTSVPYVKVAHSPTPEVLNARNEMLRVRMWEMDLVYSAIHQMNEGKQFTNFADTVTEASQAPTFQNKLDLRPSKVTWAGHSFGSATTVQFVKSVYYHRDAPLPGERLVDDEGFDMTPIFSSKPNGELVKQITPESPIVLLDLWTMPLRGSATRWLWERPLPSWERKSPIQTPNVISIMSAEFYKYPDLLSRTRSALSASPEEALLSLQRTASAKQQRKSLSQQNLSSAAPHPPASKTSQSEPTEEDFDEPAEPELIPLPITPATELPLQLPTSETSTRTPSPLPSDSYTPSTSQSSLPADASNKPHQSSTAPSQLYLVRNSAHLSQSDFGPLFPNLTRYFMKALDPEKTVELNVRGILAMMRGCGLNVAEFKAGNGSVGNSVKIDPILEDGVNIDRWERLKL